MLAPPKSPTSCQSLSLSRLSSVVKKEKKYHFMLCYIVAVGLPGWQPDLDHAGTAVTSRGFSFARLSPCFLFPLPLGRVLVLKDPYKNWLAILLFVHIYIFRAVYSCCVKIASIYNCLYRSENGRDKSNVLMGSLGLRQ